MTMASILGKLKVPCHIPTEYNKNRDKVTFSAIKIGAYHEPNSTKKLYDFNITDMSGKTVCTPL